jgi:hypothetical protein
MARELRGTGNRDRKCYTPSLLGVTGRFQPVFPLHSSRIKYMKSFMLSWPKGTTILGVATLHGEFLVNVG